MSDYLTDGQTFEDSVGLVETRFARFDSLPLDSGLTLAPLTLAYETYGTLNEHASNAILILHALSGDAHVAGYHAGDDRPGWWDMMIGPGRAFDTDKYFVICSNVIGGCKGSTGPGSIDPETGRPYGLRFPVVTVPDMVRAQKLLIDSLGIDRLLGVCGGSMGGMQALAWMTEYPESVASCIPIATTHRHSPMQIAFNEVGRQAIMRDPHWRGGDYYDHELSPDAGLTIARMIGHVTYLSDESMHAKFGRRLRDKEDYGYDFTMDFEVESYLSLPGRDVHPPVRRQHLPLHHQSAWTTSTPPQATAHWSRPSATYPRRHASWSSPSAATGSTRPISPRRSCGRSRGTAWTRPSSRSTPPTGTTPSSWKPTSRPIC